MCIGNGSASLSRPWPGGSPERAINDAAGLPLDAAMGGPGAAGVVIDVPMHG